MVKFSCRCGSNFSFPDEMAGKEMQCPCCGKLNDIPTQDELALIETDGTYKVETPPPEPVHPDDFRLMTEVFGEKTDETGEPLDLREPPGAGVIGLADEAERAAKPKYDPETGELIQPLEVRRNGNDPVNPADIPMAKSVIAYAMPELSPRFSLLYPFRALMRPGNLASMGFVLMMHVGLLFFLFLFALIMPFTVSITVPVGTLLVMMGMIAHYANVIEDIGPDQRDEVPRFLRYFAFGEDIWWPFTRVMVALFLCYGGVWWNYFWGPHQAAANYVISVSISMAGTLFFPAVILTAATSGTVLNLRPDRVVGVMRAIGMRYLCLVGLWVLSGAVYALGMEGALLCCTFPSGALKRVTVFGIPGTILANPLVALPLVIAGVYLLHALCWDLGVMYEANHPKFPWVLQRFEPAEPRRPLRTRRTRRTLPAGD